MASTVYIKSLVYLVTIGGVGFALLKLTEPKAAETSKELRERHCNLSPADRRKKELLLEKLREATTSEPIYLQNKSKKE